MSESFLVADGEPALELTAIMLNINKGHNEELLNSCKTLRDYAEYTDRVRRYAKIMDLADAVECAITECIEEGLKKGAINFINFCKNSFQERHYLVKWLRCA